MQPERVAIVGAGIGGLTLALCLHRAGIACRVYEQAAEIRPLGVGINILPHATAELRALGVLDALERVAVTTREAAFFNRFGQLVYTEPAGRWAGYETPQLSIHRGDLQGVLLAAVRERLGTDAVVDRPRLRRRRRRRRRRGSPALSRSRGRAAARGRGDAGDRLRRHPLGDSPPAPSRRRPAALVGRQHVARRHDARAVPERRDHGPGRLADGRQDGDLSDPQRRRRRRAASSSTGSPSSRRRRRCERDWNARGRLGDFFAAFADWHFDWLDVAALIERDRDRARLSDGRPGSAAALELRPRHPARRRRASDGAARLERRRPGDPRRALPRRPARRAGPRRPRR